MNDLLKLKIIGKLGLQNKISFGVEIDIFWNHIQQVVTNKNNFELFNIFPLFKV